MIDPKLNELPASRSGKREQVDASAAERSQTPRPGLSINDTIARDANLSVGSRGVGVSGVSAGAGAGAGSTYVTPGGNNPQPEIVPGARTTGTTVRGDSGQVGSDTHTATGETGEYEPTHEEISTRAYECWCERGCPHGSPHEDWERARQELRTRRLANTRTRAAAI